MSKILDDIGKEMIEWCKKEYNPNYSGYTTLIPAIEHGYSLSLERIAELEKENKEHIENVNTLAKMQSEAMGWVVESEKNVKELEKANAKLKEHLEGEIGALQLIAKHFSQSVIDDQMGEDAIDLKPYKK